MLYFESENELKFYNLEAWSLIGISDKINLMTMMTDKITITPEYEDE